MIGTWTLAGAGVGTILGSVYGAVVGLGAGLIFGMPIGLVLGLVVGFLDGVLLYWLRPAPRYTPLAAAACTEMILLPLQYWLWLAIHSIVYYAPLVLLPCAVSVGAAAALGWWLPPGAGSHSPDRPTAGPRRGRSASEATASGYTRRDTS